MTNYPSLFEALTQDSRYHENLDWGKPRRGHPEGTVRAHIAHLEQNLALLSDPGKGDEYWKLRILIHVHDSFKKDSKKGVPIQDPRSHASLARSFLAEYCEERDLLEMVQYHDEPFALYRQELHRGSVNQKRLQNLMSTIQDWELFLKFLLIDGYTPGKDTEPLEWSTVNLARARGLEQAMRTWLETLKRGKTKCA